MGRSQIVLLIVAPIAIVVAVVCVYSNSLNGVLVLDDESSIVENPTIRDLTSISDILSPPRGGNTVSGRPLLNLSLAINYAIGGADVRGYHIANIAIHAAVALLLFEIVRRTLLLPRLSARFGRAATPAALAAALIWAVHPLQTESVTYVIQRAESLVALFYLLTLYFVILGATSKSDLKYMFYGYAVFCCWLGMAAKEVMVTAPVVVLLYDWIFLSNSFAETFKKRWGLYAAMFASWAILAYLVYSSGALTGQTSAFQPPPWWAYFLTQPEVILHYLRLSVWPDSLCLDYRWSAVEIGWNILPAVLTVVGLAAATAWGLIARRPWAFLGAWFFLILSPSSSFVPLSDLAFEHRMYMPLAAVVVLAVCGLFAAAHLAARKNAVAHVAVNIAGGCLVAGYAFCLGSLSHQRNPIYNSSAEIWFDTLAKAPLNPRAHNNLGYDLWETRRAVAMTAAAEHWQKAVEICPEYADAHNNLGVALSQSGRQEASLDQYKMAMRYRPEFPNALFNIAQSFVRMGKYDKAIDIYKEMLELNKKHQSAYTDAKIHVMWGNALESLEKYDEAIKQFLLAIQLNPNQIDAILGLGNTFCKKSQWDAAAEQYNIVLQRYPDNVTAQSNLGEVYRRQGKLDDAIAQLEKGLKSDPNYTPTYLNLGYAYFQQKKYLEALKTWRVGLQLQIDPQVLKIAARILASDLNLGPRDDRETAADARILVMAARLSATDPDDSMRNGKEAVIFAEAAARLTPSEDPGYGGLLDTLCCAYAEAGQFAEAIQKARFAQLWAVEHNDDALAELLKSRISLFERQTPYRDPPPSKN
jgi:protein O-mannosyl-transferase